MGSTATSQQRVQESVWDYPRPPRLEQTDRHLKITWKDKVIADTTKAYRVLETSHPPTYYLPLADINTDLLSQNSRQSFCEWKGRATYWDLTLDGERVEARIWSYKSPTPGFKPIKDYLSFYVGPWTCSVDDEVVNAQDGSFYGGWKDSSIKNERMKGGPGTAGW